MYVCKSHTAHSNKSMNYVAIFNNIAFCKGETIKNGTEDEHPFL